MLLWQGPYFPINPFKTVLGFFPQGAACWFCVRTHAQAGEEVGGLGEEEVGSSGELRGGCGLGMLHSLRVEGEEAECQYHRGKGIFVRLRNNCCFFQTLFSCFFPLPLPFVSLLGPQVFPWFLGLQKGTLGWSQMGEACSGDPFCSNVDIPLQEAARSQLLREKKNVF